MRSPSTRGLITAVPGWLDISPDLIASATTSVSSEGARSSLEGATVTFNTASSHEQVAGKSFPATHVVKPDTLYPRRHTGWHEDPLGRTSVQLPKVS